MALCIMTLPPLCCRSQRLNLQACESNIDQKLISAFPKYLCCHMSDLLVNLHRTAAMTVSTDKSAHALHLLLKTVVTAGKARPA